LNKSNVRRNIFLGTLGASWAVIPEVFGFIAPGALPLFSNHPKAAELEAIRLQHSLHEPEELWLITTGGNQTAKSIASVEAWWRLIGEPMPLRIWIAEGTDQLATQDECALLREMTFRAVLAATEQANGGQLILSLAGGRKTMSADLQLAGSLFGAAAWLHVVGPEPMPAELARDPQPEIFARPLRADLAAAVTPLVVGQGHKDEAMQIEIDGHRLTSDRFPLSSAQRVTRWTPALYDPSLSEEVMRRQREGSQLLGNFLSEVGRGEAQPNWRSLYRLPPQLIEHLKTEHVQDRHRSWLVSLPKMDLHRHLGGCLGLDAQRRVARVIWESLDASSQQDALRDVKPFLESKSAWPWEWPELLKKSHRAAATSALLVHAETQQLEAELYGTTEPRIGLKRKTEYGFAAYERPGELSGSALLSHPASVAAYAEEIVLAARDEGLYALELRGSPHKYSPNNPVAFVGSFMRALQSAGARTLREDQGDGPRIGFTWILDRRQSTDANRVIEFAVEASTRYDGFVVGIDLAGDEGTSRPQDWARVFEPAFRECLSVTIHAGEDEPAQNIWEAAYSLHADRIGHGLTLTGERRLMTRFRDRGICLELCPSSNREVVGFYDPAFPASKNEAAYPLRTFLDAGVPLTICTDNPGISRTTLADEYLAASRMIDGGLTLWEALSLTRQAFIHSFLPSEDKSRLIEAADAEIWKVMTGQRGVLSITEK
jgi:adenosine deaminase